jgi:hypothetical protein
MVDSVLAFLERQLRLFARGDTAASMAEYWSGPVVTVDNGRLITSRDSLGAAYRSFYGTTRSREAAFSSPRIDVVAPGVAALTSNLVLHWTGMEGKPTELRGVYSAVLAVREGRVRIIQEHEFSEPPPRQTEK